MVLLFPGRHHLLTNFQYHYLMKIILRGLELEPDRKGNPTRVKEPLKGIVFAVTSANHQGTRRNPLPLYLRVMALQDFAASLGVDFHIYAIDDVGHVGNFADYTLKKIEHESEGQFKLNPENSLVLCSTPVGEDYEKRGFRVLPAELVPGTDNQYRAPLPWELVEQIARDPKAWLEDEDVLAGVHPASLKLWERYHLAEKIGVLFQDTMLGEDGDLTETRDYNSYVRQMDDIAQLKFDETREFIVPGRIGDIGCAVGSWLKLAMREERFRESDFYGVEVSRHLLEICEQRKSNGEFENPYVFFSQKNAVTGLVFAPFSMQTIHTSSLTHEIESYGSRADLLAFIKNRYRELAPGGIWINRDVVGPRNKERLIWLWCNESDGENADWDREFSSSRELEGHLNTLSTAARFKRFMKDFRKKEGGQFSATMRQRDGKTFWEISLELACEFYMKKDYTDNWESEMHERFCFWDFAEWQDALRQAGFEISSRSALTLNDWIVQNRLSGKVALFERAQAEGALKELPFPPGHMILVAGKKN